MRDLNMIAAECMRKLDAIGIPYRKPESFTVNTRAKKRWGQCVYDGSKYHININVELLKEENDIRGLEDTIIHELLHTCEGCMNHGSIWKTYALKVSEVYGYYITRTASAYEAGIAGAKKPAQNTHGKRKRNQRRYDVKATEQWIAKLRDKFGYKIITIVGYWIDSYICIAPNDNYYNLVYRANDDLYDGYYTQRRCRKISAALQAEIDAACMEG